MDINAADNADMSKNDKEDVGNRPASRGAGDKSQNKIAATVKQELSSKNVYADITEADNKPLVDENLAMMHSSSRSRINSQLHTKSKTEEPLAVQVTELDKPPQSQKDTNE